MRLECTKSLYRLRCTSFVTLEGRAVQESATVDVRLQGNYHHNLVIHVCFSFLAGNDTLVIHALQWLNRAGEACQGERGWQEAGAGTGRRGSAPGGVRQVYLVGSGKREMSEAS